MINMPARTLCLLALLISQQPFAQDLPKGVPIEQEPRHRIVFENKYVRIYDALIPPGDLTLFHTHAADNVTVVISGGKGTNEFAGKPEIQIAPVTGNVNFSRATATPYTHRIGNAGTTPLRFVVSEVKAQSDSPGTPAALDAVPGHKLMFENERVKVYRVALDPKQSTGIRVRTLPWVRVSLSPGTIAVQESGKNSVTAEIQAGDYRWHEGPTSQSLQNIGAAAYEAIEIEWK